MLFSNNTITLSLSFLLLLFISYIFSSISPSQKFQKNPMIKFSIVFFTNFYEIFIFRLLMILMYNVKAKMLVDNKSNVIMKIIGAVVFVLHFIFEAIHLKINQILISNKGHCDNNLERINMLFFYLLKAIIVIINSIDINNDNNLLEYIHIVLFIICSANIIKSISYLIYNKFVYITPISLFIVFINIFTLTSMILLSL